MSINDRGSKKWTAMMMPEHINKLKELRAEYFKEDKPVIDEQQLEEMNLRLALAQKDNLLVEIMYFSFGEMKKVKGYVDMINYIDQYIVIDGKKVDPRDLIDITIL